MKNFSAAACKGQTTARLRLFALVCLCGIFCLEVVTVSAESLPVKKVIHQYALTSANDFPQRDPRDWRLLASNDNGRTWVTLDVRENEIFSARQQRKLYQIDNTNAFTTYRLQIDQVRDMAKANSVQLAEIELMGLSENDFSPMPIFTDMISTRGDNPPAETVVKLFDGHVETKWLDWRPDDNSHTFWVQWQYATSNDAMVTNIAQLLELRQRANDGLHVRIEATVVGITPEKKLSMVDVTGCMELGDIHEAESLNVGQKILITGLSTWNNGQVDIRQVNVMVLGTTPVRPFRHISLEQPLPPEENLQPVEVEGQILYLYPSKNEVAFDLQDGLSSMRVHMRCQESSKMLHRSGTRVLVQGICQGAFNDQGQWVATTLWTIGQTSLMAANTNTAKSFPTTSPAPIHSTQLIPTILTTIDQIWRLSPAELKAQPHVRIRAIVTDELQGFIQDNTAGIEISFPRNQKREIPGFGAYIDVEGSTGLNDAGNPEIVADHITILGNGKPPAPQKLSPDQFANSRIDAQWIEVEGVVRSTDGSHLLMTCYGQQIMAAITEAPVALVNGLVDADVRVQGVGVTARDAQGRAQGIHLLIPSLEYVNTIIPPTNPARLQTRKIGNLLGLSGPWESFHRVKVEGVVTLQQNQKVFIQDQTGSAMAILKENVMLDASFGHSRWLYWQTLPTEEINSNLIFSPGDRVQIVGFTETHRYSPVLTEAVITKLGDRQSLKPTSLTADGLAEGGLDSCLVTFEGIFRGQTAVGINSILELEWQDRTLQVFLPKNEKDLFYAQLGSRLRVTGICQIDPPAYSELGLIAGSARILTRSPEDLLILAQPSWWTVQRALAFMGGMIFVILAGLIWIRELRRQVEERTSQLTTEIQLRERVESRHALEQERARIAKDLHDDLGANLTQIIFLSERVEVAQYDGQEVAPWFDLIPTTARRTIQSLDEIVWAINPQHDSLESLANYLSQFAQQHLALAGVRCVLDVPTVLPALPLSAEVRHNLLLTTREALQNAVTHAAATEVHLYLKLENNSLTIAITDNGSGFDPNHLSAHGNGLSNMRLRLQAIGGKLTIDSRVGNGTTVSLQVPESALHVRVIVRNGNINHDS